MEVPSADIRFNHALQRCNIEKQESLTRCAMVSMSRELASFTERYHRGEEPVLVTPAFRLHRRRKGRLFVRSVTARGNAPGGASQQMFRPERAEESRVLSGRHRSI